jgi:hypothetical protein
VAEPVEAQVEEYKKKNKLSNPKSKFLNHKILNQKS